MSRTWKSPRPVGLAVRGADRRPELAGHGSGDRARAAHAAHPDGAAPIRCRPTCRALLLGAGRDFCASGPGFAALEQMVLSRLTQLGTALDLPGFIDDLPGAVDRATDRQVGEPQRDGDPAGGVHPLAAGAACDDLRSVVLGAS